MVDKRCKNAKWSICDDTGQMTYESASLAVLMDIRDELQGIRSLLNCHRIPPALDALREVGQDIRRKKRLAATKRKNAKARAVK